MTGSARVQLADLGIQYVKRAFELRPKDPEAIYYLRALHRQRAYAFFDQPDEWARSIEAAQEWLGSPAGPDPGAQPAPARPGTPS